MLFDTDGVWHPAPEIPNRVLEQLFSAQLLSELTRLGFFSPDLVAQMRTWKHTGLNVDWGRSIPPENRAEREGTDFRGQSLFLLHEASYFRSADRFGGGPGIRSSDLSFRSILSSSR